MKEGNSMKIVAIAGSIVGSKTKTAMTKVLEILENKYPQHEVTLLDLADYSLEFSDGRNYFEYDGDTNYVTKTIMEADAIIIGTPIFQASIPATLKNIFDLLPVNAFRDKVVSTVVTAGTAKHYLMVEQQLKPILAYMKAHIVPTYVFIEEKDFLRKEIVNDDILFRLERLVEDTIMIVEAFELIRAKKDEEYDF
jgi:FMN reductase